MSQNIPELPYTKVALSDQYFLLKRSRIRSTCCVSAFRYSFSQRCLKAASRRRPLKSKRSMYKRKAILFTLPLLTHHEHLMMLPCSETYVDPRNSATFCLRMNASSPSQHFSAASLACSFSGKSDFLLFVADRSSSELRAEDFDIPLSKLTEELLARLP